MAEIEGAMPEDKQVEKPEGNPESTKVKNKPLKEQAGSAVEESAKAEQPVDIGEQQAPSRRKMAVVAIVVMTLAIGAIAAGIISGRRARMTKRAESEQAVEPTPTPAEEKDALLVSYERDSDSDEIADIEADLNSTSFKGIDAELSDIDSELSAED